MTIKTNYISYNFLCQCQNKYKAITRKRKLAVDNNRKSGSTRIDVEFEDELSKIAALDDSIEPEVLRGVNYVQYKDTTEDRPEVQTPAKTPLSPIKKRWRQPKKSPSEMLRLTLVEIEKRKMEQDQAKREREQAKAERETIKEANKQKRHEEKMKLMQLLFQTHFEK